MRGKLYTITKNKSYFIFNRRFLIFTKTKKNGDLKGYLNNLKSKKINALKENGDVDSICVPLDRQLDWSEQLLCGLKYLSSLKDPIMHRDIKPEFVFNFFLGFT